MGCDIHLILEYRTKPSIIEEANNTQTESLSTSLDKFRKKEYTEEQYEIARQEWIRKCTFYQHKEWQSFSFWGAQPWGERIYGMFAKLANVRNYVEWNIKPYEVKGFPIDASKNAIENYTYKIINDDKWLDYYDNYQYIKRSDANKWINEYNCNIITYNNGEYVTCPDFHSASYCSTSEMENAINEIFSNKSDLSYLKYASLLSVMKTIESSGIYECRAVFWFDN